MKKKIFLSFIAALSLVTAVFAQDARNRATETIVSDVLAQLPASNAEALEVQMADLAKAAPASIRTLAAMFQPAEAQANNKLEYAVSGVVRFVSTPEGEQYKAAVSDGLQKAVAATEDSVAKAFLEAELRLLGKFEPAAVVEPSKDELLAKARLLAKSDKENERIQSLWLYDDALGAGNASRVIAAMKDGSRPYRWAALETAKPYADNAFYKKLAKACAGCCVAAKDDILYWLGEQKAESQIDFILKQFSGKNAAEAITAAGKIGGEKAADALLGEVGGAQSEAAVAALENFNGDIRDKVLEALGSASAEKLDQLMLLAAKRHITAAQPQIMGLAKDGNATALSALPGVVSPKDTKQIATLLDSAQPSEIGDYTNALINSVSSLSPQKKYDVLSEAALAAVNKDRFARPIAATGTDEAVALLAGASLAGYAPATQLLATIENPKAGPYLLSNASKDEAFLSRYVYLVNKYETSVTRKSAKLIDALGAASSDNMKIKIISSLSSVPTTEAFWAVVPFLENETCANGAANAIRNISAKVAASIPYEELEKVAGKAIEILSASPDPDDGYAADAIRKTLSDNKPLPVSELTAEEKEAGFIMLYDGTGLDNWIGDKEGYQSYNGVINVTANYGGTGNLYTKDEYRNFIYRFEFRFLVNAANNGVGLRGPATGVDAAYDAMCEVQILDHDDPVYANLRAYQVHGSVYGVIPAKRIVHKPLGEWEYEEIKVEGDHITVTVNGEVIVDGNIREACQGHNVDPDGGERNPYTVDHLNHPGMFNEKGHISFCGHGRGLQFRNVRILPLD